MLLSNLRDWALSRKRWETELIAVAAIGDRSNIGLNVGLGTGGKLSIVAGDLFSTPWECQGGQARIAWHAVYWLCTHTHTHKHADSLP